jgi:hypothetical protein
MKFIFAILFLTTATWSAAQAPRINANGDIVVLQNDKVRLEFNLATGTYAIFNQGEAAPVISHAKTGINEWFSDAPDMKRSWQQREITDALGKGLALDLTFQSAAAPELRFSFVLHEGRDFLSASGGIRNTTDEIIRIKDIHVLADGILYQGSDLTRDFAMIDGFSGGEPLEYGQRFYSPLTRGNALKSRNNILLTFTGETRRHSLVMGGLTYQDFEKFAHIAQPRRTELELGSDGVKSLLCYLDLPKEKSDRATIGETLELIQGSQLRTWQNHEFRASETATSVMEPGRIIIAVGNLHKNGPYTLGFSWWQGLWHGEHPGLHQSVFVEFENDGTTQRLPLLENRTLPRFDGTSKQDVEQVELSLPAAAIQTGSARIIIEKAAGSNDTDPNVYLSEIWLRDGRSQTLLDSTPTPVSDGPRPRRQFIAQLFAKDPVGKRVDPGQLYLAPDSFYINVTGSDPFEALENYAMRVREAQQIELSMYDFPTVCLWYASDKRYGGRGAADNTTLGAVNEMRAIRESGFLNYSRAAVRLVPDSYMPNNQQGWWDDEHWQRDDTDRDTTQNGRHVEPYETTEKWGKAVTDLGGIPLTYFQTAWRSEDYAAKFPGHMLFNKQYAWKGAPVDTQGPIFTTWQESWNRNGKVVWGYDFTDPDFLAHMENVYANLKNGGIRGLMFDYPESGWASAGGMEDDYSTTAAAYRKIYQLAHDGLGPEAYVHERNMLSGSDVTLGVVASMRTENDTDAMDGATVTRCGMRWYKNRVLINQDADSKNLVRVQDNRDKVRAILTMCYVTTGRLLLANSFTEFSSETFHDLTRTFPYHSTTKSARPVDAFVADSPAVYAFVVNPQWQQVTFFNADPEQPKTVGIDLSGPQVNGALGLDPAHEYHAFDFWNHRHIGKFKGDSRLEQTLRPGEARMISIRRAIDHPQVLSTNRHVMQGYLDLLREAWNGKEHQLSGTSKIVANDPYTVTLALNEHALKEITSPERQVEIRTYEAKDGLVEFTLTSPQNATVEWTATFEKQSPTTNP